MDHETAVRLLATERYLLRQMDEQEQEAFEEHYFLCPVCAEDVRSTGIFIHHAREVFRAEHAALLPLPQAARSPVIEERKPSFLDRWLPRPLSLAMNVALAAGVIYLGAIHIPRLQQNPEFTFADEITVMKPSRGDSPALAIGGLVTIVSYDGDGATGLTYEFLDSKDQVKLKGTTGAPRIDRSGAFHLPVSTRALAPGEYEVFVTVHKPAEAVRLGPTRVIVGNK